MTGKARLRQKMAGDLCANADSAVVQTTPPTGAAECLALCISRVETARGLLVQVAADARARGESFDDPIEALSMLNGWSDRARSVLGWMTTGAPEYFSWPGCVVDLVWSIEGAIGGIAGNSMYAEVVSTLAGVRDDLEVMRVGPDARSKHAKGLRTKKFSKEQIQAAKTLVNDCIELLREQGLDSAASKLSEYAHFWEWPNLSDELADVIEEVKDEADSDLLMLLQSAWDTLPVDEDSEIYEEDSAGGLKTKSADDVAAAWDDVRDDVDAIADSLREGATVVRDIETAINEEDWNTVYSLCNGIILDVQDTDQDLADRVQKVVDAAWTEEKSADGLKGKSKTLKTKDFAYTTVEVVVEISDDFDEDDFTADVDALADEHNGSIDTATVDVEDTSASVMCLFDSEEDAHAFIDAVKIGDLVGYTPIGTPQIEKSAGGLKTKRKGNDREWSSEMVSLFEEIKDLIDESGTSDEVSIGQELSRIFGQPTFTEDSIDDAASMLRNDLANSRTSEIADLANELADLLDEVEVVNDADTGSIDPDFARYDNAKTQLLREIPEEEFTDDVAEMVEAAQSAMYNDDFEAAIEAFRRLADYFSGTPAGDAAEEVIDAIENKGVGGSLRTKSTSAAMEALRVLIPNGTPETQDLFANAMEKFLDGDVDGAIDYLVDIYTDTTQDPEIADAADEAIQELSKGRSEFEKTTSLSQRKNSDLVPGLIDEAVDAAESAGDTNAVALLQDLRRAADAGLWDDAMDIAEQVSEFIDISTLLEALQAMLDDVEIGAYEGDRSAGGMKTKREKECGTHYTVRLSKPASDELIEALDQDYGGEGMAVEQAEAGELELDVHIDVTEEEDPGEPERILEWLRDGMSKFPEVSSVEMEAYDCDRSAGGLKARANGKDILREISALLDELESLAADDDQWMAANDLSEAVYGDANEAALLAEVERCRKADKDHATGEVLDQIEDLIKQGDWGKSAGGLKTKTNGDLSPFIALVYFEDDGVLVGEEEEYHSDTIAKLAEIAGKHNGEDGHMDGSPGLAPFYFDTQDDADGFANEARNVDGVSSVDIEAK